MALRFLGFEPVVARNPGVVFVDLAVAMLPGMPLGGGEADPDQEADNGDAGFAGPVVDEINEGIAGVVGEPRVLSEFPMCFFLTGRTPP